MAEFLSPAWITELDRSLQALSATAPDVEGDDTPFVVEQRITVDDHVAHVHHIVASGGGFHAVAGAAADPDLVLTTDLPTAVAIQRGIVNAQDALAGGHLRLGGDLDRLRARTALFARLDDVFSALREHTTYPAVDAQGRETPPLASPA